MIKSFAPDKPLGEYKYYFKIRKGGREVALYKRDSTIENQSPL